MSVHACCQTSRGPERRALQPSLPWDSTGTVAQLLHRGADRPPSGGAGQGVWPHSRHILSKQQLDGLWGSSPQAPAQGKTPLLSRVPLPALPPLEGTRHTARSSHSPATPPRHLPALPCPALTAHPQMSCTAPEATSGATVL